MWNNTTAITPATWANTPDVKTMLSKAREAVLKNTGREAPPTSLVMTDETLEEIKRHLAQACGPRGPHSVDSIYGIPVESFATRDECIHRVIVGKMNGERPHLILSAEDFDATQARQ